MQSSHVYSEIETRSHDLNGRLEEFSWALFLVLIGVLWILPASYFPSSAWLVGAGVILLGLNFVRYFVGIKMSGFTVFLGIVALVAGLGSVFGFELPIIPAVLIIVGASLLVRAIFKKAS
jgi:hypothetical protein